MAYVKFKNKDEVSTKSEYVTGHKKTNRYRRVWKYGFILSLAVNAYFIYHFHLYEVVELWLKKLI